MSYKVYDTPGTFTDTTNRQEYIYANGVNLTCSLDDADVFMDANDNVTATAVGIFVFVGSSTGSIALNGTSERVYGGAGYALNVDANGMGDQVFGSSAGTYAAPSHYVLAGANESFSGGAGVSVVTLSGSNGQVTGRSGSDTINVILATASNAHVDAGGGTLNINDYVGDTGVLTVDVGKNLVSNAKGLSIANVGNLDYMIADPNSSARRTAATLFTVEAGNNTLNFSYSSGTNTVYNTGSGTTLVVGGAGTDTVVGGSGTTTLETSAGTETLYGGSGQNMMQQKGGVGATGRFYAGAGHNTFEGFDGEGNQYMYGAGGTDLFNGGSGTNVLVEGTHSDVFHGSSGADYIYGNSGASQVYGGSGTDFVYTGASNQYFYSGTGKEYLYEEANTLTNGRLDVVDNFQTQSAGGKGTFIFEPAADRNATTFVASNGGTYIVNPAINMAAGTSDVFVPNVAPSIVKAQTYFIL